VARGARAVSDEHGRFEIAHVQPGTWYLVVQKGQFRRVTSISVRAGQTLALRPELTTLPSVHDPGRGM